MGQGFLGEKRRRVIQVKTLERKDEFTNDYCFSKLLCKPKVKHETRPTPPKNQALFRFKDRYQQIPFQVCR
jgi:hypothetical protein